MPQKKKTNKKTNKKTHKKHLTQKQNIIFQSIPNYASGQTTGHQYNKDHVQFVPQQAQQSHTDNIVGELVGRLMNKIENNENKEVQQYTKEVQPINNNNNVNVYNNVPGTTTIDKKPDETPSSDSKPDSKIPDSISNGVKSAARSVGEDFAIQAGAGLASIVTAALGTAGIRNRKAIRNSISNFPSNARNSLGTIRERFRGSSAYRPQVDVVPSVTGTPSASVAGSRRPSNASNRGPMEILSESIGMSPARAARPPRAASASPRDSEVFIRETESAVARRNRPRSDSISSNYNTGDVTEHFSNARTPAARKPPLNSEERSFVERTFKKNNIDPSNISPIRQDVLRGGFSSSPRSGRPSGIQQHDGVNTRAVRAQTGEPHTQLQTPARRGRGRPQTNEYARPIGPARPVGRPRRTQAQAALSPQAQPILQTPARGVTRNISNWKSN